MHQNQGSPIMHQREGSNSMHQDKGGDIIHCRYINGLHHYISLKSLWKGYILNALYASLWLAVCLQTAGVGNSMSVDGQIVDDVTD